MTAARFFRIPLIPTFVRRRDIRDCDWHSSDIFSGEGDDSARSEKEARELKKVSFFRAKSQYEAC